MWVCMYIWLRKCSCGNITPEKNYEFQYQVWLWFFNVASLYVCIWKWLVKVPLANFCCPTAEIGVGGCMGHLVDFFVVVVLFSLWWTLATTTLPRIGLNLSIIHNSLFHTNVLVYYVSMGVSRRKWVSLFIRELWEELSVSSVWWQCVKH